MGSDSDRQPKWEVQFTTEAERWYMSLEPEDAHAIAAAFDRLAEAGPAVRRPLVGAIRGSRHHNMKEVRSVGGHLRALFAFDPCRRAVVLLGGEKTGDWKGWYARNIPAADRLYDKHLRTLGREPPRRTQTRRAGARSADSGR